MKLERVVRGTGAVLRKDARALDIKNVSSHSRNAKKNGLFIAIHGHAHDGRRFIEKAVQNGARVVVSESAPRKDSKKAYWVRVPDARKALSIIAKNFYGAPSDKMKTIGVTGTNGKTTVTHLVERIFRAARIPCGIIGTIAYRFDRYSVQADRTTPDALTVNRIMDTMRKAGARAVAMEVSSHALEQKRVEDINFDTVVFTNLTHEHLDYHRNMDAYFASKAKLFRNIKANGSGVINVDDVYAKSCARSVPEKRRITYGLDNPARVSARIERCGLDGSRFSVVIDKKEAFSVTTKLVGRHNISNILAGIGVSVAEKLPRHAIQEGIEALRRIPGRLEPVDAGQPFKVFVDYAHTHHALENVLRFLRVIGKGKIIVVFGCGGERDRAKRPIMARVAQEYADQVILTNDNPRNEDPKEIMRDIQKGLVRRKTASAVIFNRERAIKNALKNAGVNDIVLLAGKGHERIQCIGNKMIPFDDREVADRILRRMYG